MKSFLKFMLVLFIWLIVLGICIATTVLLELEIMLGIWVFVAVLATWYGIKLFIYLFKRLAAKNRVEKLINIGTSSQSKKTLSSFQFLFKKDIDKHLNKIQAFVKHSDISSANTIKWVMHLKVDNSDGDWVKAQSINKPKITDSTLTEYPYIDWHIFNDFMMLDVDAYLISQDNPAAKSEWLQLLNGLAGTKRVFPVDSLLISINVNAIETIIEQQKLADLIRTQYEDIKTYCGVEIKINIALIGLEQLSGIDSWLANLDPFLKQKMFGYINEHQVPIEQLVKEHFSELKVIFNQGALSHLVNEGFSVEAAQLPAKANEIEQSLSRCLNRLFANNSFQSAPKCSGLFIVMKEHSVDCFVDGLLEGSAFTWSDAIKNKVVTQSDIVKRKRYITYASASAFLVSLIFITFDRNIETINAVFDDYKSQQLNLDSQSGLLSDITLRYSIIEQLEALNISHWLPTGNDPLKLNLMRANVINKIENGIITALDEKFSTNLQQSELSLDKRVDYINILSRRINLIKAAQSGANIDELALMPQPYDSGYISDIPREILEDINNVYLLRFSLISASSNSRHSAGLESEKQNYQKQVVNLLSQTNDNMQWLVDWVNENQSIKNITLQSYWQGTLPLTSEIVVKKAYTVAGKEVIDNFFNDVTQALGQDNAYLLKYKPLFLQDYRVNYLANWGYFLSEFEQGQSTLADRNQWLNVINNLTTSRNIYFKLLNDVDFQLASFKDDPDVPKWLEFSLYYQDMLALSDDQVNNNKKKNAVLTKLALKVIGKTGAVGKAISKSAKSGLKTQKKLDKANGSGPGPSERELNLQKAATELDNYKAKIAEIVFSVEQKQASYTNISGLYTNSDNPTSAGTSLSAVQMSLASLQGLIGKEGLDTAAFWKVYKGPVQLLESFMAQETACKLNDLWQEKILFEIEGVPDYKLDSFAYGETGILWSMIDSDISPFLRAKLGGGYSYKRLGDNYIALTPSFLNYLTRVKDFGMRQKFESFSLDITANPTSLNPSALLYVSQTDLVLNCASGPQSLVNNNFIVKKHFAWDQSCGPVSLSFTIGNKKIVKEYPGQDGLTHFMEDFKSGKKRFELETFPESFYVLDQFKIRYIDASFILEGAGKLLSSLNQQPPKPPKLIAQCWK